jgi:hypothetical protein
MKSMKLLEEILKLDNLVDKPIQLEPKKDWLNLDVKKGLNSFSSANMGRRMIEPIL